MLIAAKSNRIISVIIPFLNESESLEELARQIESVLGSQPFEHEIVFINDGSTDDGARIVRALCARNPRIRMVNLMRNFGKASALSAGIAHSRGDVVISMDADLQDDPNELLRFLEEIDAGYDVVSGWKQVRNDPISKTLPSKMFNYLIRKTFALDLHDINCGFKAYTRAAARALNLYGELHRFTPALLHAVGFSVKEIPVNHNPRRYGTSKYGFKRFIKGLLDLVTVVLLTRYQTRPLHFFGGFAMLVGLAGVSMLLYLVMLWFLGMGPIGNRPLFFLGILLLTTATQLFGVGLIAELLQTSQLTESGKYAVRELVGFEQTPQLDPEESRQKSAPSRVTPSLTLAGHERTPL
ncbi:MAG: glycosyltransferase family 2 protein [Burkholderiales bacterium]